MLRPIDQAAGEFQEREHGKFFTYRQTENEWALGFGMHHEIDVLDGVRYGNVLKTVAHVCVDQGRYGEPIKQAWSIRNHHTYGVSA